SSAIRILSRRCDPKFLEHFFRKVGAQPTNVAAQNLRRIDSIPWMQDQINLVDELDEAAQQGAIQFALACNISRATRYRLIEHLLRFGKPGGRRAAAHAVAAFHGAEATQLVQEALQDPDPQVRAHVLVQLRPRGVSGALPYLLSMLDEPHEVVRTAA